MFQLQYVFTVHVLHEYSSDSSPWFRLVSRQGKMHGGNGMDENRSNDNMHTTQRYVSLDPGKSIVRSVTSHIYWLCVNLIKSAYCFYSGLVTY
eukprot:SAG31_NODE_1488_length_8104_cov_6.771585_3_plen_93_part_00